MNYFRLRQAASNRLRRSSAKPPSSSKLAEAGSGTEYSLLRKFGPPTSLTASVPKKLRPIQQASGQQGLGGVIFQFQFGNGKVRDYFQKQIVVDVLEGDVNVVLALFLLGRHLPAPERPGQRR